MADNSDLDKKYFVSEDTYNCPFCKRRNVLFSVKENFYFDWTDEKECNIYIVECSSCKKKSIHFAFEDVYVKDIVESDLRGRTYVLRRLFVIEEVNLPPFTYQS